MSVIYEALAPSVLGYLRGHRAAEPEDLASEVFVALVKGLPKFRGDEPSFRSWVFTIAHRRLQDERRRLMRRPVELVPPERLIDLTQSGDHAEDEALARLQTAEALRTLDQLTPEQREVVLLRVVADLPIEQVARIMGRSPGAVKALQHRALAALARRLDPEQAVSFAAPPAMTGAR